jgi:phosphomannomutase / phosphoglucomutase
MPNSANNKPASKRAGITVKGNALYQIAALVLLAILIPVSAGFAYLILLREPAMQTSHINTAAASFATQQAANVSQLFSRLGDRVRGAALSPLALASIIHSQGATTEQAEKNMLAYFPELISLKLVPMGEKGTAAFEADLGGLRNHIEVDLVRRTSRGEETHPEAYLFENSWLTSMAYLVSDPQIEGRKAVLIATIDNQMVSNELKALDTSVGRSAIQLSYSGPDGSDRINDIAVAGTASDSQYTSLVPLPNTPWSISFTPSQSLLGTLAIDPLPLLTVLGLVAAAIVLGVALAIFLFHRTLAKEIDEILLAASRKTPLKLRLPGLFPIATHLRRVTLRTLPLGSTNTAEEEEQEFEDDPPCPNTGLVNPMFQSAQILDDEDSLELELEVADPELTETVQEQDFPRHIFRAYDIRGIGDTELTDELVALIGGALGSIAFEQGENTLIVACDGRLSSPRIKSTLIQALLKSGRDVIDLGVVPTPLLYYATQHLDCNSGVMVTGSHNPAEYNGLKVVLNQRTIAAGGIQDIYNRIIEGHFTEDSGQITEKNISADYVDEVVGDIAITTPLKIVIDAGNGVAGNIAPGLFAALGCDVVPLYCDVDGNFPNHPPDTSNEANLAELVSAVQNHNADFGVAFDGDGDRLAVISSSGQIVRSDVLLMIYAQDVLTRNPGADVVFDVKCSRHLPLQISQFGGRPILWKTGHAFMKEKMQETGALLGGEFSGHMFFGERWFGFDDGMYATARLAEIISNQGASLDQILADLPDSVNTPEIFIPVAEEYKFSVMSRIIEDSAFSDGKVNTLDGIRVDFKDGWGLLRASNTNAVLTARFEASSEEALEAIKQTFRVQINAAVPDLELNF